MHIKVTHIVYRHTESIRCTLIYTLHVVLHVFYIVIRCNIIVHHMH